MRALFISAFCFLLSIILAMQFFVLVLTELQMVLTIGFALIFFLISIAIILEFFIVPPKPEQISKPTIKLE